MKIKVKNQNNKHPLEIEIPDKVIKNLHQQYCQTITLESFIDVLSNYIQDILTNYNPKINKETKSQVKELLGL